MRTMPQIPTPSFCFCNGRPRVPQMTQSFEFSDGFKAQEVDMPGIQTGLEAFQSGLVSNPKEACRQATIIAIGLELQRNRRWLDLAKA